MFNKSILIGRLVADPELKKTPNDVSVVSFRIAVDRPYRKDAERQADFIDIVAWRGTAEFISEYFKRGSAIGIEGRIQTRNYTDKEGNKRTAFEVLAENTFFVEGSSKGGSDKKADDAPKMSKAAPAAAADDFQEVEEDDDLPF